MKKVFQLLLLMVLPLTASADPVEIDGIWYNLFNKAKTAEVTRNPNLPEYVGCYSGDITIPSKVTYGSDEYSVTTIGNSAFLGSNELTSLIIPNSITSIGNDAFEACTALSSLVLPNSITSIGNWAFCNCTGLTSLTLSNSINSINGNTFKGCSSLRTITIPSSVTSIGSYAFLGCSELLSICIPNSVTEMGSLVFYGCSKLNSVVLSDNLTYIGVNAFQNCTSLSSISIPNSVMRIYSEAFKGCSRLTTVTIGSGISNLYFNSFANCDELSDVYCFAENVPTTESDAFENSYVDYATLHVPASAISAYSASAPWSGFGTITAISSENITIGADGIGTFCGSNPIDFSGTEDIKAYVVSSYESATGQVTLSRVRYVPPFTGVVVKGAQGTYPIPAGVGQPLYPNLLKGVTANTALSKVSGDYTNYVLAKKGGNLGFYAVANGSTLSAGKAYLPLPTADLPSSARELVLTFDDGETTSIKDVVTRKESPAAYYDLQGRRVENPRSGLYIVNGKKVIIK